MIANWTLEKKFREFDLDELLNDIFIDIPDLQNKNHTHNSSVSEVYCPSKPKSDGHGLTSMASDLIYDFQPQPPVEETYTYWFFTPKTAPLYLLLLLPIVSLKSATFFTKFNAIGTLNVFFLMGVIMYLASQWGIHVDLYNYDSPAYVPTFKKTFPSLSGMMALGLFIHNAIITIMRNNRHQENNVSEN